MDSEFFNGLVKASLDIQGAMMDSGYVSPPCLWAFRDGRPVAQVVLRQVAVGEDAEADIAEMAHMATASRATEVVAVWGSWGHGQGHRQAARLSGPVSEHPAGRHPRPPPAPLPLRRSRRG